MSEDHRFRKPHNQPDVEKDEDNASTVSGNSTKTVITKTMSRGIPAVAVHLTGRSLGSSTEEPVANITIPPPNMRCKTLIRGHALEGNSPPPESFVCHIPANGELQNGCFLACGGPADTNGNVKEQSYEAKELFLASHKVSSDSGNGTFDCNDDASDTATVSPVVPENESDGGARGAEEEKDSSLENASIKNMYTDLSKVDIPQFMKETLQKSHKDRKTILCLENEILAFVNAHGAQMYKMRDMSSYERMIVHRLAAFLGLKHNVDTTGKCVILNRTENTRSVRLSDLVLPEDCQLGHEKKILKKPASFDEKYGRGGSRDQFGSNRAKSLEERQQNYIETRERIFKNDENQYEELPVLSGRQAVDLTPQIHKQQSQDSIKCNGQPFTSLERTESSGNVESEKEVSNTNYNTAPSYQSSSSSVIVSVPASSAAQQVAASASEVMAYPVTQFQQHTNPDALLYQFDPTCPPPFMVQPTMQPPPATPPVNHVFQNDNISDVTAGVAGTSIDDGCESFPEGVSGQPVAFLMHPQSLYAPSYQSQIMQDQYLLNPSLPAHQQPLRYVAFPYHHIQGQHLIPGATVDAQGQATVPMPAVGIPSLQGIGGYQMIGSPYQSHLPVGNPPQRVDHNSFAYQYGSAPEGVIVGGAGGLNTSANVGAPGVAHVMLPYAQSQTLLQQHAMMPNHQAQFAPAGSTTQGTYYTIPASSPTPPLSLTQPPPSSHHHQQHQQAVFFASNIGNQVTYPIPVSNPSSSSSSAMPMQASFLHTSQQPLQQFHPHHPQPVAVSPSSSQLPAHWAMNYSHPVPFNPCQSVGQVPIAQRPQFVALQPNPYQIRPVGPAMFQLAGNPMVQVPQLGTSPHFPSYHLLRPVASLSDVRMMNPGSIRSRVSPLPTPGTDSQQSKPKFNSQYRQLKKVGKKFSLDIDNNRQGNQATTTPQQIGYTSLMTPLGVPGSMPYVHSQLPSSSSHRDERKEAEEERQYKRTTDTGNQQQRQERRPNTGSEQQRQERRQMETMISAAAHPQGLGKKKNKKK